jgi:hypothetical protein
MERMLGLLAAALLLAAPVTAVDLTGTWRVDEAKSDNAVARIDEGAGPGQVKSAGRTRIIASSGQTKEPDRVALREQLLALAAESHEVDVVQTDAELRISTAEKVRVHYFGREHARNTTTGVPMKCNMRWKGDQLVIEQKGDDGLRVTELFTLMPGGAQLMHQVRFEHDLMPKPVEIRRVYDRVPGAPPAAH